MSSFQSMENGAENNSSETINDWRLLLTGEEYVSFEAGATFDNSFFDNCFGFLRQCKDRSFLGTFTVHKKGFLSRSQN